MKILFSNDKHITQELINKAHGLLVFGNDDIQVCLEGEDEVDCFTYHELVSVTFEVLKEVRKAKIFVFDIPTGTNFNLYLTMQTIQKTYEIKVDLTVNELKQMFEILDYQKIVIHDPVNLQEFYNQEFGSLQAYVVKMLSEISPL